MMGFGMIIADVQLRTEKLGAKGWLIGCILASTFVVQTIFSPIWSRLGDRTNRKTIFALCTLISGLGMAAYGIGDSLWLILLSRLLAGLGAANVALGQAMVASQTPDEERTRVMGWLSAIMSLGLIVGPAIGGTMAVHAGSKALGLAAAALSAVGFLCILVLVPSSPGTGASTERRKWSWSPAIFNDFPRVRPFLLTTLIAWTALALLEGTFARLIKANLGLGSQEFGWIFGYESALGLLISGVLLVHITRVLGDRGAIRIAFFSEGIGLGLTPLAPSLAVLFLCSTFFAGGTSVANPTVYSLVSRIVPEERHGELFGLIQSIRGAGFVIGPIVGGSLFDISHAAPYFLAGFACLVAGIMVPRDNLSQE